MKRSNEATLSYAQPGTVGSNYTAHEELRRTNLNFLCKRLLDLVVSALLVLLLSPFFLLITIAVRLDSTGPALYRQERVGARRKIQDGKVIWETYTFCLYKFRSMFHNADPAIHHAYIKAFVAGEGEIVTEDGARFKLDRDPRVTRIGKLLRRTSMDELPQLLNVLKGEMSLVGPRPVPTYEVAEYKDWHYARLMALPGITGLWQVQGRGRVTFEEMMHMDIEYTRNQSLWLDLKLLWLTIPSVLCGRGAK
jgi:lipopolysaccharide/colanic/teichoic acid biosynthesis glycosyltransferase